MCLKFRTAKFKLKLKTKMRRLPNRGSAVKCLSQGHNRMAGVGFEPRLCR